MNLRRAASRRASALVVVDCQHDFLHPQGVYARAGLESPSLAAVPEAVSALVDAARSAGMAVVATRFTLWPGHPADGGPAAPLVSEHLRRARPFLGAGHFVPGGWGHACIAEVGQPDATIDKVTYSAFAHTHLGWLLTQWGISHLVVAGIVTNGGVASTVRDAHGRDLEVTVVRDACAAFDPAVHEATCVSLESMVRLATVEQVCDALTG